MNISKAVLVVVAMLFLSVANAEPGDTSSKLVSEGSAATAPHEVSSQVCSACHQEIYKEWKGTKHAISTALNNPIHGAFYRKVMGDPTIEGVTNKKGAYPVCLKCHAPNAAIQRKTKLDSQVAFNEGVNCIACHMMTGFKGVVKPDGKLRLGVDAYEISKTHLQAPSGRNFTTRAADMTGSPISKQFHAYPMEGKNSAFFQSSNMCMGCHDRRNNSHGVPLCATGDEIKMSGSDVTCQSCHMPVINGRASHAMVGGHNQRMVSRGIVLKLDVEAGEEMLKADITLKNQLPHNFPTGAPFRNAYLVLTAFNAEGEELWKNYETHPLKDDKKSSMVYTLGDGKGNPSGPPAAKEVLSDTRLKPHEKRELTYDIPANGVVLVRAEIMFNLVWPKMKKMLAPVVEDETLLTPKRVAFAEVDLRAK